MNEAETIALLIHRLEQPVLMMACFKNKKVALDKVAEIQKEGIAFTLDAITVYDTPDTFTVLHSNTGTGADFAVFDF